MAVLRLKVLGGFAAESAAGEAVAIPVRKGQALLVYLALEAGRPVPRRKLAGLLWSDRGDKQASTSLRQTLTLLRKALDPLGAEVFHVDRHTVALDPAGLDVDAVAFRELVAGGMPTDLEAAIALYRGELLDGFDVSDPAFTAWLEEERRHLRASMCQALAALVRHKREAGAAEAAVGLAEKLLAMDPLHEPTHRELMLLYGNQGDRQAALRQYQRCRDLLQSELGVAPDAMTEALYQALCGEGPVPDRSVSEETARRAAAPAASAMDRAAAAAEVADLLGGQGRTGAWRRPWLAAVVALTALAVVGLGTLAWIRPWAPDVEPASIARMAFPLPDKPSIAVLPFVNLSDDPEQAYFADGFADDVITDLSKLSGLFVIARNSTLVYKDNPAPIRQVAEDLGVQYVLEGSVRRVGEQLRINTQLIDAVTGGHLWAERYDVPWRDVLAVQDQVTHEVVTALEVQLTEKERSERARRETKSPEAYDAFLKAREHHYRYTREDLPFAILYYEKAIRLDPDYARAHINLGSVYWELADSGWESHVGLSSAEATAKAEHHLAVGMKNPTPFGHYYTTKTLSNQGRYEEAIAEAEKMIALYPNDFHGYKGLGRALNKAGRAAEAIAPLRFALRLDPRGDDKGWMSYRLGEAYYLAGHFDEAAEAFARSVARNENEWSYFFLAVSYGQLGRLDEAKAALDSFNRIFEEAGEDPYTVARIENWAFKNQADRLRVQEGARKAGLPEGASTDLVLDLPQDISPTEVEGATTVDAPGARQLIDQGATVIDVRDTENWNVGHIFGARHLPLYSVFTREKLSALVAKDEEVIFVDAGPPSNRAARAAARAVSWGFEKVYYFRDGFAGWKSAGYPIQVPPT